MVKPEQPAFINCTEKYLAWTTTPDNSTVRPLELPSNKLELPRHDLLLPDRYAGNVKTYAIHGMIGCHVERGPIFVTPRNVGCVSARDKHAAKKLAARVDDV